MSLLTETVILRRRGVEIGKDRYGRPVFGPGTDTPSPAWWEAAGALPGAEATEDQSAAEQQVQRAYVYLPPQADVSYVDAVVLGANPSGPEVPIVASPFVQPGGLVVDGYIRLVVELVTG